MARIDWIGVVAACALIVACRGDPPRIQQQLGAASSTSTSASIASNGVAPAAASASTSSIAAAPPTGTPMGGPYLSLTDACTTLATDCARDASVPKCTCTPMHPKTPGGPAAGSILAADVLVLRSPGSASGLELFVPALRTGGGWWVDVGPPTVSGADGGMEMACVHSFRGAAALAARWNGTDGVLFRAEENLTCEDKWKPGPKSSGPGFAQDVACGMTTGSPRPACGDVVNVPGLPPSYSLALANFPSNALP